MVKTEFRYPGEDRLRATVVGDALDPNGRVQQSRGYRSTSHVLVRFTAAGLQNISFFWKLSDLLQKYAATVVETPAPSSKLLDAGYVFTPYVPLQIGERFPNGE